MMKPSIAILARLLPAVALFSCVAPKATVVEAPPEPKKEKAAEPEVAEAPPPSLPGDGLRLPDMENLPGDQEFRMTNPALPTPGPNAGTVIARPPTDPPPRPKPKNGE